MTPQELRELMQGIIEEVEDLSWRLKDEDEGVPEEVADVVDELYLDASDGWDTIRRTSWYKEGRE